MDALKSLLLSYFPFRSPTIPSYRYYPLQKDTAGPSNHNQSRRCIRLIYVESVSSDNVTCRMEVVDLDDNPPEYQCLSYTWGNPFGLKQAERRYTLFCSGGSIEIRQNLYDALYHLWETEMTKKELSGIWIDAVCINQADTEERNQQVSMMTDIYQGARRVIAWLGPEDEHLTLVEETIELLWEHDRANPGFMERFSNAYTHEVEEIRRDFGLPEIPIKHWVALYWFFHRVYFTRAWIVQEIVVAKELIVYCGSNAIHWKSLVALELVVHATTPNILELPSDSLFRQRIKSHPYPDSNIVTLNKLGEAYASKGPLPFAFFQPILLYGLRAGFQATDERDRLFSLKGICNELDEITVDYQNSAKTLYTDFAWRFCHQQPHGLSLLAQVEQRTSEPSASGVTTSLGRYLRRCLYGPQSSSELPSWVPDLSKKMYHLNLIRKYHDSPKPFQATLDQMPSIQRHGDVLRVEATRLDILTDVSESASEMFSDWSMLRLLRIVTQIPQTYKWTSEDRGEAFWRTIIVWSPDNETYPSPFSSRQLVNQWLLDQLAKCRVYVLLGTIPYSRWANQVRLVEHLAATDEEIIPSSVEIYEYCLTLMAHLMDPTASAWGLVQPRLVSQKASRLASGTLKDLRVFRTKQNYLGKGYSNITVGDSVWLIRGAEIPYILRRTCRGRYRLIGQAYVHGIMFGEAVAPDRHVTWESIEIE